MKEQEVSATVFKRDCLRLVGQVEKTRVPIRVTRRGKVVARLVPAAEQAIASLLGSVTYDDEADLLSPVDEGWEADS